MKIFTSGMALLRDRCILGFGIIAQLGTIVRDRLKPKLYRKR